MVALLSRTSTTSLNKSFRTAPKPHSPSKMTSTQSLSEDQRLPFDILLELIRYLDPDHDIETLKSLSTTCHALYAPFQRHLFSSITIRKPPSKHIEAPQDNCLLMSPHLISYIQRLDYRFGNGDAYLLEMVLNRLPVENLEVLKISTHSSYGYSSYGHGVPRELIRTLRSPCMRRLQLHGLVSVPWFTTNAPNLTDLVLDIHSFQKLAEDVQPVTLGVKSLTVTWRSSVISDHLNLVFRCSPLLLKLRCYGKRSELMNSARIETYIGLESSFTRGGSFRSRTFHLRRKLEKSVHTGDFLTDTLYSPRSTSQSASNQRALFRARHIIRYGIFESL